MNIYEYAKKVNPELAEKIEHEHERIKDFDETLTKMNESDAIDFKCSKHKVDDAIIYMYEATVTDEKAIMNVLGHKFPTGGTLHPFLNIVVG